LTRNHRVEDLANAAVSRMSPRAKAKARSAPHDLLSTLERRSDLWTLRHVRERIERRPHALERIGNGLTDSPADLCQGVGELGVPAIPHGRILSLAKNQSQGRVDAAQVRQR
jgi:hypothetical protein